MTAAERAATRFIRSVRATLAAHDVDLDRDGLLVTASHIADGAVLVADTAGGTLDDLRRARRTLVNAGFEADPVNGDFGTFLTHPA